MREIGELAVHLDAYDFADHGRLAEFGLCGRLGVSWDTSPLGFARHGLACCGIVGWRPGKIRKSTFIRNEFELYLQAEIESRPGVRQVRPGEARH
jgi:hypothetical protein